MTTGVIEMIMGAGKFNRPQFYLSRDVIFTGANIVMHLISGKET